MTRERAKELLPIIIAYAEGKVIQAKFNSIPDKWHDRSGGMSFDDTKIDFRIKPELREFWIHSYSDNTQYLHGSKKSAQDAQRNYYRTGQVLTSDIIHVREVIE